MNYAHLSNADLVRLCGREPGNRDAWRAFVLRFDGRIRLAVFREYKTKINSENEGQIKSVVDDLVQDVYTKLVENQAKALKVFKGANDNSIFKYLGMIAKNTVLNYAIKAGAQKRQAFKQSLDRFHIYSTLGDALTLHQAAHPAKNDVEEVVLLESLLEEIDTILDRFYKGKHRLRNKLLFRLYFVQGLPVESIAETFFVELSKKRINNIISEMKNEIQKSLSRQDD